MTQSTDTDLPLAGLKVLDFTWVMAGPATTRYLADYGATVVKLESATRIETGRTLSPYWRSTLDPERSAFVANNNAGKLDLALNLHVEGGRAIARRLVQWADVVAESFTPKVMRSWGLDYEALRQINPSIVMLSSSLNGLTGPQSQFAGFGTLGAALAGFIYSAGWPERPPAGPTGAYTDYISPKLACAALMAALDHRRRTGVGQLLDFSQAEASVHFLGPAVLDYTTNGRLAPPAGNHDPAACPHGVYPCAGQQSAEETVTQGTLATRAEASNQVGQGQPSETSNDRWIALAAETPAQWRALRELIGGPLHDEERFGTLLARRRNEAALDEAIGGWTAQRDRDAAEAELVAAGVPASAVITIAEIFAEPQLNARGHFVSVPHATLGSAWVENSRTRMSGTPARVAHAGPALGQHSDHVLRELLGLSDDEIADAVAGGAIE